MKTKRPINSVVKILIFTLLFASTYNTIDAQNLAQGATTTYYVSSTSTTPVPESTSHVSLATDGLTSTQFSGAIVGSYIKIFLGDLYSIERTTINAALLSSYRIESSLNEGGPWTTLANMTGSSDIQTQTFPAQSCKYIRLVIQSITSGPSGAPFIYEIGVFGATPLDIDPQNRAVGKITKYTLGATTTSANAITDNDVTTNFACGGAGKIKIDLGAIYSVKSMTINAGLLNSYELASAYNEGGPWTTFFSGSSATPTFLAQNCRWIQLTITSYTSGPSGAPFIYEIGVFQNVNGYTLNNLYVQNNSTFIGSTQFQGNAKFNSATFDNVGIGTSNIGSFKLAVEGKIGAREVNVLTGPWPDYVFENSYKLPSLEDVNAYIQKNKHLPEVPSASVMIENGVNLGEMNVLLMKKIEELTLYVIKQNERINILENSNLQNTKDN